MICADIGNSASKVTNGNVCLHFASLVAPVTAPNTRGKVEDGYFALNGNWYAVGEMAKRHHPSQDRGARRWYAGNIDVLLAVGIVKLFDTDPNSRTSRIKLVTSYAPRDLDNIKRFFGALGVNADTGVANTDYVVESSTGKHRFTLKTVSMFDEPIGGLSNLMFTKSGTPAKNFALGGDVLTVDVGGYTTDLVPLNSDGSIDVSAIRSVESGVQNVKKALNDYLRSEYSDAIFAGGNPDFNDVQLERWLQTRNFVWLGKAYDIRAFVDEQLNALAYDTISLINSMGGIGSYHQIVLTGGGGALLQDYLTAQVPANYRLADEQKDDLRYANVKGLYKLSKALSRAK